MATPIQIPVGRCSSGRRNMTCSTQESLRSLSPTGSFVLPLFDGNAGMHTNRGIGLWAAFITAPRLCPARTCTGGHIYGAPGPAGSRRPGSSLPRPRRPYHHMPMARVWRLDLDRPDRRGLTSPVAGRDRRRRDADEMGGWALLDLPLQAWYQQSFRSGGTVIRSGLRASARWGR